MIFIGIFGEDVMSISSRKLSDDTYLYNAYVDVSKGNYDPSKGVPLPDRTLAETIKSNLPDPMQIAMSLSQTKVSGLSGQNTMIMQTAYSSIVVAPRTDKSFKAEQDIQLDDLRKNNQRGDPIQQLLFAGSESQNKAMSLAKVWIVSSETPQEIEKTGKMDKSKAVVCFSEQDAQRLVNFLKENKKMLENTAAPLQVTTQFKSTFKECAKILTELRDSQVKLGAKATFNINIQQLNGLIADLQNDKLSGARLNVVNRELFDVTKKLREQVMSDPLNSQSSTYKALKQLNTLVEAAKGQKAMSPMKESISTPPLQRRP